MPCLLRAARPFCAPPAVPGFGAPPDPEERALDCHRCARSQAWCRRHHLRRELAPLQRRPRATNITIPAEPPRCAGDFAPSPTCLHDVFPPSLPRAWPSSQQLTAPVPRIAGEPSWAVATVTVVATATIAERRRGVHRLRVRRVRRHRGTPSCQPPTRPSSPLCSSSFWRSLSPAIVIARVPSPPLCPERQQSGGGRAAAVERR